MLVNNTPHAVAAAVLMDAAGRETFVVAVKATFRWAADRTLAPAAETVPVVTADRFGDPPEATGLLAANELTLPKPRVDVLVRGEIVVAAPVEQIDCALVVGDQIQKVLRVVGDRHFRLGGVAAVATSAPRPFSRMPIAWERSSGGRDPDDPAAIDLRNPVGRGVRKRAADLEGQPAPNFEDPRAPVREPLKRPAPVGFGPVAPHWQPRCDFAGTYDAFWEQSRYPALPADYDPRFLNAAPIDQQLDRYQPGAPVRLVNFTPAGRDGFVLPELAPAITVVEGRQFVEVASVVDTLVIEPSASRLTVIARATYTPTDVQALKAVYVGALTQGQRRALAVGKPYLRLGA